MSAVDTRTIARDSLFLMATLRHEGADADHRVKVRNLSAGGMMAEGDLRVERGTRVNVELRNIGWIDGSVAWVQDNRCGVAFATEIDPKLARANLKSGEDGHSPRFVRPSSIPPPQDNLDSSRLRKL